MAHKWNEICWMEILFLYFFTWNWANITFRMVMWKGAFCASLFGFVYWASYCLHTHTHVGRFVQAMQRDIRHLSVSAVYSCISVLFTFISYLELLTETGYISSASFSVDLFNFYFIYSSFALLKMSPVVQQVKLFQLLKILPRNVVY